MKNQMIKNFFLATLTLASLTGCASVTQDKTQPIKVEALDSTGQKIEKAECILVNDRGEFNVETPRTVQVRKSAGDLTITCKAPEQKPAEGKLISRTGGAVFGNIILGGVIGAVVDTASGVAYNYPEWVQLVFGKNLVFDRNHTKAGVAQTGQDLDGNSKEDSLIQTEENAPKIAMQEKRSMLAEPAATEIVK